MKTRIIASLAAAIMALQPALAQDQATCESIVQLTYEALNKRDASALTPHLARDFSIAGQTGEIAQMVLPQLIAQLNVNVSDIGQVSAKTSDVLTLVYEATFSDMGKQTSTFVFNKQNQIQELELVRMKVKTMKGDTQFEKNVETSFSVPFRMAGKLILVEANLNGVTRNFIVDSGAPTLVLNAARQEKQEEEGNAMTLGNSQGVSGSISGMDIAEVESFDFAGIRLAQNEAIAMDLGHLEEALGIEFHGLIGYDVFKQYDVLFNYADSTLTFIDPKHSATYLKNAFKHQQLQTVPLKMSKHIPTVSASIGEGKYALGIDCGAEANLLSIIHFDALNGHILHLQSDTLIGADNNATEVPSGDIAALVIGKRTFVNTSTSFSDIAHLNDGYDIELDGLIGYEVLSKQPTLLSFANEKMVFICAESLAGAGLKP